MMQYAHNLKRSVLQMRQGGCLVAPLLAQSAAFPQGTSNLKWK